MNLLNKETPPRSWVNGTLMRNNLQSIELLTGSINGSGSGHQMADRQDYLVNITNYTTDYNARTMYKLQLSQLSGAGLWNQENETKGKQSYQILHSYYNVRLMNRVNTISSNFLHFHLEIEVRKEEGLILAHTLRTANRF